MNLLTSIRNPLDDSITNFFRQFIENESWVEINTIISCFYVFFIVIAILFLFKKENRWAGILMLITILINFISNDLIIKKIVCRDRPFVDLGINPVGFHIDGYSFPSGHSSTVASGAFTFFFYYLFINKRENKTYLAYSIVFIIIALLVMMSRIALLHHYFTDCLAGLIEGVIYSLIVVFAYKGITSYLNKKKSKAEQDN